MAFSDNKMLENLTPWVKFYLSVGTEPKIRNKLPSLQSINDESLERLENFQNNLKYLRGINLDGILNSMATLLVHSVLLNRINLCAYKREVFTHKSKYGHQILLKAKKEKLNSLVCS